MYSLKHNSENLNEKNLRVSSFPDFRAEADHLKCKSEFFTLKQDLLKVLKNNSNKSISPALKKVLNDNSPRENFSSYIFFEIASSYILTSKFKIIF